MKRDCLYAFIMKKIVVLIVTMLPFVVLAQAPIRIVCVGNSITEGYSNSSAAKAWPAQLGNMLGRGYSVLNCGVSGTNMLKKGSSPYWNTTRFTDARNADPQILIISLGTNDAGGSNWTHKSEFKPDYLAMISEFRKNGRNPIIYVCYPVPVFANSTQNYLITNEVIPLITQISKEQATYVIDYNTPFVSHSNYFPDGVHPDDNGALEMAKVAFGVVRSHQVIVPYIAVNGGASEQTNLATVSVGNDLTLKTEPLDGTYSWTGPNGYISTSGEITLTNIQPNQGGIYTAIYTNPAGGRSIANFMVTLNGCTAKAITPFYQIGGTGTWPSSTSAKVNPGGSITLGPQPLDAGTWNWIGPNGFFSSERQFTLSNIRTDQAGDYSATFYTTSGCKSTKVFNINVDGTLICPTITPYLNFNGAWKQQTTASISSGASIAFGPQPSDGSWSWVGPDGYTSIYREAKINSIKTNQAGVYIGTFSNVLGCVSSVKFTITVDGITGIDGLVNENSVPIVYPNPANDYVTLKDIPANTTITVLDSTGRVERQMKSSDTKGDVEICVSNLKSGVYLIQIEDIESKTFKFLKL